MMEKVLTDPTLTQPDFQEENTIKKKNLKIRFLESENESLRQKMKDLERTLMINKDIIGALVDAIQSKDYRESFELF